MPRFIALLRGINVGGHNVKMERLRELFVATGFARVETFIASGNVIFDAAEADPAVLTAQIEAALQVGLGYRVDTFLRTPHALSAVASFEPFPGLTTPEATLYITFFAAEPEPEMEARVLALRTPDDEFRLYGRELYWLRRKKISETTISDAALARAIGVSGTMRNANTVRRLAAKYPA
jgi:uncharacterized protein (DUF1697 family)